MKIYISLLILAWSMACRFKPEGETVVSQREDKTEIASDSIVLPKKIQRLKELSEVEASKSYDRLKQELSEELKKLKADDIPRDSLAKLFETMLVRKVIPFWEGTEWSFEGHTSKPQQGSIACGYFVSTTLRDVGLNINRYRLAQQSPINEAKSLSLGSEILEIEEYDKTKRIATIKNQLEEGIHFVGFDASHVGYIFKQDDELYLIHSNYMVPSEVVIEHVDDSAVFDSFDHLYLVPLSTNETLLRYWTENKPIEVIQK